MALKFSNSQEFLNKLQLYINAFIAVPMLGFIVLFLRIENRSYNPDYLNEDVTFYLRFIVLAAILCLIVLGLVLSKKIRKILDPNMSIRDKLNVSSESKLRSGCGAELLDVSSGSKLFAYGTIVVLGGLRVKMSSAVKSL